MSDECLSLILGTQPVAKLVTKEAMTGVFVAVDYNLEKTQILTFSLATFGSGFARNMVRTVRVGEADTITEQLRNFFKDPVLKFYVLSAQNVVVRGKQLQKSLREIFPERSEYFILPFEIPYPELRDIVVAGINILDEPEYDEGGTETSYLWVYDMSIIATAEPEKEDPKERAKLVKRVLFDRDDGPPSSKISKN